MIYIYNSDDRRNLEEEALFRSHMIPIINGQSTPLRALYSEGTPRSEYRTAMATDLGDSISLCKIPLLVLNGAELLTATGRGTQAAQKRPAPIKGLWVAAISRPGGGVEW